MTPEQAKDEILRLRGLFPSITPEQGRFWKDELQKYALDDVQQVVDEHFQRHEFFNSWRQIPTVRRTSNCWPYPGGWSGR